MSRIEQFRAPVCRPGDDRGGARLLGSLDTASAITDATFANNKSLAGSGYFSAAISLGDNGGPTPTLLPSPGSPPLRDAGRNCPATDQRGVARNIGQCTIGAVE